MRTSEGIGVGDTRAAALSAGAWDGWDADGDGVADSLGIGAEEVPDAESLTRPGEVGRLFVLLALEGDRVTQLQSPSNDFADI